MNKLPTPHSGTENSSKPDVHTRRAGVALMVMAGLVALFMAMHPTAGTHDPAEFVRRVGHGVPGNTMVHGGLITLLIAMVPSLMVLRELLSARNLSLRFAMVALVAGTASGVAAGLVNGFMVPSLAAKYVNADDAVIATLQPALTLAHEVNGTCARTCVVGLSLSAVIFSLNLLGHAGLRRVAGAVGLVCGLVPLGMHAAQHLHMNVSGFGLFVWFYSAWMFAAGLVLLRWPQART